MRTKWPGFFVINRLIVLQRSWTARHCSRSVMQDYSKYCREEIKFTCAVCFVSSISSVTLTYMWSKGVHACSIHVTRVISFTLVNICKIINIKKNCTWRKVAEHKLRSLCLVVLDVSTSHYHLPHFFSVSPVSNPVFCPVSLSIKSPLPVEIFYYWLSIKYTGVIIAIVFRPTFISFLYKVCW